MFDDNNMNKLMIASNIIQGISGLVLQVLGYLWIMYTITHGTSGYITVMLGFAMISIGTTYSAWTSIPLRFFKKVTDGIEVEGVTNGKV